MIAARAVATGTLLTLALVPGCGLVGGTEITAEQAPAAITVSSPAFRDRGTIPARYTCKGSDISPPLHWSGIPTGAARLALVVDDPDAPGGTYVHWVVFNIDPGTTHVVAGRVPSGGQQARTSAGETGYAGPCPPSGAHHYRFTIYALRQAVPLSEEAALKDALAQISKRSIAKGRLIGLFGED